MVLNDEKCHYLAITKLSALLREITSKDHNTFYHLNFLHSFRAKIQVKSHEKVCRIHDFCDIVIPNKNI